MAETHRILHMLPDLQTGGGQSLILNNISHMDKSRFRNIVCYVRPENDFEQAFLDAGIETFCLDHRPGHGLRTLLRLVRLIRRQRIEIVHTNNTRTDRVYGQMAALLCRVPVVNNLHMPSGPGRERLLARPFTLFQNWLWRLTVRHVIAVSEEVRSTWVQYNTTGRFSGQTASVINAGIDLGAWSDPPDRDDLDLLRRDLGLERQWPLLINVGRLVPQKGQHFLIPMMAEVVRRFPDAHLLVVGEGDRRAELEEEIERAGLRANITLLGTRHDVSALLALSDLYVFPSVAEGLGVAVIEAMAAGKPVVAFRIAPLTEFIEHGGSGYLVEPLDVSALARSACDILSDPDTARAFAERGRRIAAERFDIGNIAREVEAVYLTVLAASAPAIAPTPDGSAEGGVA